MQTKLKTINLYVYNNDRRINASSFLGNEPYFLAMHPSFFRCTFLNPKRKLY